MKTRLWPHLNHRQCLLLHRLLISNILKQFSNASKYKFLVYTTDKKLSYSLHKLKTKKQNGFDLGLRMYNVFKDELKYSRNVILIGSDCVQYSQAYISKAFNKLETGNDIVLGPTNDGGYCLVGMKKPYKFLFEKIAWSTSDVLQESQRAANRNNKTIYLLDSMNDIDTIDDLNKLHELNALPDWLKQFI